VLNRKESSIKEAFMDCLDKFEVGDGLLEIGKMTNSTCSNIMNEISSEIYIKPEGGFNTYLVSTLIICTAFAGGSMAVLAGAIAKDIFMSSIFGGVIGAVVYKNYQVPLYSSEAQYRSLINFLLQQLKPLDDAEKEEYSINSPFDTEEKLVNKWKAFGYTNMTPEDIVKDMPFRTDAEGLYIKADNNSKMTAVHRIRSIVHLHDVRRKLLEHAFVTAIGPQNAGKTTSLVSLFPGILKLPNSNTIKIGIGNHTRSPVTYEFEHLSIVDFPGLNAVNEDEHSAPNLKLPEKLRNTMRQSGILASIILCIFKFEGSVTSGLKELVDLVEPYLGEVPVLLCLNQVGYLRVDILITIFILSNSLFVIGC
jgi:hypothetical protein